MSKDFYKQAFEAAIKDISDLMTRREKLDFEREELDKEIMKTRAAAASMAMLIGEDALEKIFEDKNLFPDILPPDIGLTNAVRKVLQDDAKVFALTAMEVRKRLQKRKFKLEKYQNEMASIHTVLKRLYEAGEVEIEAEEGGKSAYLWKPKTQKAEDTTEKKAASAVVAKTTKGKKKK